MVQAIAATACSIAIVLIRNSKDEKIHQEYSEQVKRAISRFQAELNGPGESTSVDISRYFLRSISALSEEYCGRSRGATCNIILYYLYFCSHISLDLDLFVHLLTTIVPTAR